MLRPDICRTGLAADVRSEPGGSSCCSGKTFTIEGEEASYSESDIFFNIASCITLHCPPILIIHWFDPDSDRICNPFFNEHYSSIYIIYSCLSCFTWLHDWQDPVDSNYIACAGRSTWYSSSSLRNSQRLCWK